jgi:hypothetical protein
MQILEDHQDRLPARQRLKLPQQCCRHRQLGGF